MKKYLKQYALLSQNRSLLFALNAVFLLLLVSGTVSCGIDDNLLPDDSVDKFLGTWNVSDQPARINYEVTIKRDPNNSVYVLLMNFADMGESARGLVVGDNVIIEMQDIGSGFSSSGTGTYKTPYELEFLFILDDGIEAESRKAVFTR